jgi:hypothetical protein
MMTTDWIPYTGAATDAPTHLVYDGFWGDATNAPTDFCNAGCDQLGNCPGIDAGVRWWGGGAYLDPVTAHGFTVGAPADNGAQATAMDFGFSWQPAAASQCYIILETYETYNDCTTTPPLDGFLNGVIYNYGTLAPGGGFYYYSNNDLTGTGLFHQMPADGTGGFRFIIASAYDPTTGAATIAMDPGDQIMLWAPNNTPAHPGQASQSGYDDDTTVNGTFDPGECYDYSTGGNPCPDPLTSMLAFRSEASGATGACCLSTGCQILSADACAQQNGVYQGDNSACTSCAPACYANCDGSTTSPCLNVLDFGCFLNRFGAGDTYANCDGSTTAPVLNVLDFGCFLNRFGAGCGTNC